MESQPSDSNNTHFTFQMSSSANHSAKCPSVELMHALEKSRHKTTKIMESQPSDSNNTHFTFQMSSSANHSAKCPSVEFMHALEKSRHKTTKNTENLHNIQKILFFSKYI
ncbi:MAG: hypothetical protein KAS12_04075 [Candidatus Aenigmarchaeota archaeon]|nr:hypothetical protein [Candidatus Aenigmarchaeota archaeon]